MPLQATSGAASYDAFGGGVPFEPTYIEQIFATHLYTGNGSTQTITNGIDLAGEGGLTVFKNRSSAVRWDWIDTARGMNFTDSPILSSNTTNAQATGAANFVRADATGFSLGTGTNYLEINQSGQNYASWTFREQPKFFDVVTWTGTGANRTIAHNLGSVPGFIIVKRTNATADWQCYHRSLANTQYMVLNSTAAVATGATRWNSTTPTSTVFSLGTDATVNASGGTYVAYLFAHDAGGFGLTGTDNVISCGSFTTDGSGNATVNLGYEPQWILSKASSAAFDWEIADVMRGMSVGTAANALYPNLSSAESTGYIRTPTATGFNVSGVAGANTFIYIAIRRGPMKVPETGTSVLGLNARTGTGANATVTGSAGVTDLAIIKNRGSSTNWVWTPRLTGTGYLSSNATTAETAAGTTILQANPWDVMDGIKVGTTSNLTNASGNTFANYLLDRAPGFMDVCCYTGTGVARTVAHNLAAEPELMIVKSRSAVSNWRTYNATDGNTKYMNLQDIDASVVDSTNWNNTSPTSSAFTVGTNSNVNASGGTFVAYLFASCPGVSKVFSYTGNGTSQTINCGFTGGARFVMIKRTDSTGDWYVWDSARGIVSGNDPRLSLNTTAAEVTTDDSVDTDSTGFVVNQLSATNINVSSATYIGIAIA